MHVDQDTGELVKILETRDQGLVATIQALLDGADIEYAMNNEFSQSVVVGGGLRGVQFWVRPEDEDMARHILSEMMETEATTEDEPAEVQPEPGIDLSSYPAPKPEQPFIVRLLWLIAVLLIPLVLVILCSLKYN